MFLVKKKDRLM